MALKTKRKSLADKIGSLITTKPSNFGSDDEDEDTKAKLVEHYDESDNSEDNLRQSKIRKLNVDSLDKLDKRYAGKKVSRKDIYSESEADSSDESLDEESENDVEDEEMESSDENGEEELSNSDMDEQKLSNDEDVNSNENSAESDDNSEEEDDDDDDDGYDIDIGNPLYRDRRTDPKFKTMSNTNMRADIDKGNCVRTQLKLWESLLEMRIKLQKCVVTSNSMPQHNEHKNFKTDSEFLRKTNETKNKLTGLLNNMLQLQSFLLKQYPETKNLSVPSRKRKAEDSVEENPNMDDPMDEEIPSDTEDEQEAESTSACEDEAKEKHDDNLPKKRLKFSNYEEILDENHRAYVEYRNSVIQKWNEKTRIATGNVNKGMSQTTLKQIEFALNDKPKLRKRTQLKRSEYKIVGKTENTDGNEDGRRVQEYDPEIYDDDDFYHQLLRDLIEYKSSDVTDPIQLSQQWIKLQNMRRKMKRKIDTRATKGRRIRYNVHNKLVNFMAPITVHDTWTEHAKTELYNSLFGKIKSTSNEISQ